MERSDLELMLAIRNAGTLAGAARRLDAFKDRTVADAMHGDWATVHLGDIAEVVGGVTKDAKRENDPDFVEVPYLRVANVQRGFLDLKEMTTIGQCVKWNALR